MVDANSTMIAGWGLLRKLSLSMTSYIVLLMRIAIRFLPELWTEIIWEVNARLKRYKNSKLEVNIFENDFTQNARKHEQENLVCKNLVCKK